MFPNVAKEKDTFNLILNVNGNYPHRGGRRRQSEFQKRNEILNKRRCEGAQYIWERLIHNCKWL